MSFTSTDEASTTSAQPPAELITIDLRNRWLAALLAWLFPGAGHLYQRRYGKAMLFMICILGTFLYGILLGSNRVVYASFRKANNSAPIVQDDIRYAFLCQIGIGLPVLPAIIQAERVKGPDPKAPLWGGFMAPPVLRGQLVPRKWVEEQVALPENEREFTDADFSPDTGPYRTYLPPLVNDGPDPNGEPNQYSRWQDRYGAAYELGTVFTMIAGLLNILVVFDAWAGPMMAEVKISSDIGSKSKAESKTKPAKI
ncbi:MAG: DUF6677 family protein [Planctomycetota bacterium]|nr:DUF6677 family protein [Planctomycetota bacterium]